MGFGDTGARARYAAEMHRFRYRAACSIIASVAALALPACDSDDQPAGNSGGNLTMLMNNSNPAGLLTPGSPIAMGVGLTHLLIGRIDWNPGGFETVSLWVDPSNVTSEGAAGATYLSTSAFELTAITGVRPFVGNTAGGFNAVSANFDEFRLGGTWESVTSLAVVPEPTSAALLGLGALSLAFASRRKR